MTASSSPSDTSHQWMDILDESLNSRESQYDAAPSNVKNGALLMSSLSKEQVSEKIRNMFQSGLAIHLKGDVMDACKAVATSLFPHQRLARAWMFERIERWYFS